MKKPIKKPFTGYFILDWGTYKDTTLQERFNKFQESLF